MRKLTMFVIFAGVVLILGSTPARAQTQISMGGASSGTITFTGTGSMNLSMTLGSCALGSTCTTGAGTGTGMLSSNGFWELSGGAIALTFVSGHTWTASGTWAFAYGTAPGGTNLLAGTLKLVDFFQSMSTGTFNNGLVANLSSLSGSLASVFTSAGAIEQITLNISPVVDLTTLGTGGMATATVNHGSIAPTPEPSSLLLLGSGLVGVGLYLRRRLASVVS